MASQRQVISTKRAPAAIGAYSQAIRAGSLLFLSGQVGLDPESGQLAEGPEAQTRRALQNLLAVLEAAGAGPEALVKTTVYLTDLGDYGTVNEVYAERFGEEAPARAAVEVSRLPKDAVVEIEGIAVLE